MKYTLVVFLLCLISCGRVLDQGEDSYILFVEPEAQLEGKNVKTELLWFLYLYLGGASWIER